MFESQKQLAKAGLSRLPEEFIVIYQEWTLGIRFNNTPGLSFVILTILSKIFPDPK
jgi:hypothetical protein